ncbi:efflux RND transporter periplasmic adaptor subunit [Aliidiomarina taiwanensis]|nr:efflux RND transporter periplasmic adaptor subunit [Aliidiomarina taiwanensis]
MAVSIMSRIKYGSLVTGLAVFLSACGGETPQQTGGGMPPPLVTVEAVKLQPTQYTIELPGRLEGSREVQVSAQVSGILLERRYHEGDYIKQGETLFLIDPEPYELALENAKAELASAQTLYAQAERDWLRIKDLYQTDTVSEREYEQARATFENSEARLAQAEAGKRNAERNLRFTRVEAPISGYTGSEQASEGNLIQAGQSLTYLVQTDPMYVQFSMGEKDLSIYRTSLRNGDDIEDIALVTAGGERYEHTGSINFIDNRINASTSRIGMRGVFKNPNQVLSSGEFVRVVVTLRTYDDTIVVPQSVISQGPNGPQVFVVNEQNLAQARPVQLGPIVNGGQVILEGLSQGEQLIVNGHVAVRHGAPVQVTNP